jgi:hypothetical protein
MTAMPAVCRNFPTRFAPKLRVAIVSDTPYGPPREHIPAGQPVRQFFAPDIFGF